MDSEETIKKSYYAIIPAHVRYDERLPMGARFLYGEITALCNEKGYCWAGNKYFAELYKVTDRTIRTWIAALITNGYIVSDFKYKQNSKEVEARYLKIISTGMEENFLRYGNNFPNPQEKNFLDNNTMNNTYEYNVLSKDNTCQKQVFDSDKFVDMYNSKCSYLPKVVKLTDDRKRKIKLRLKTYPELEWWETVFEKANKSDFCINGKWCNFDFFISNDTNPLKVYEGKYDNKGGVTNEHKSSSGRNDDKYDRKNGWF